MKSIIVGLVVGLLSLAPGAWADRVVPTERVRSRAVVREQPTSQSADIGSLRPGESLEFVRNVPRWREVRLSATQTGFVTKSYTRVVSEGLRARQQGDLRIHFLNIGAGTCTVVECPGANAPPMVIDCGSLGGSDSDMDRAQAATYVQNVLNAHTAAPNVVLSHADADHYGFIPTVLSGVQVTNIFQGGDPAAYDEDDFPTWLTGQTNAGAVVRNGFPADFHNAGDAVPELACGDALTFILTVNSGNTSNSPSLVLLIEYEEFTAIFTGDAEGVTEDRARTNFGGAVLATVLSGSHHGASTHQSNDDDWADVTAPTITVFSSGTRFGHPRCDAARVYDEYTVDLSSHATHCGVDNSFDNRDQTPTTEARYVTEVDGTIVVTSSGESPASVHCTGGGPACGVQIPH